MINHWYFGIILIVKQKESVYICLKPVLGTQIVGMSRLRLSKKNIPPYKKKRKKFMQGLTPLKILKRQWTWKKIPASWKSPTPHHFSNGPFLTRLRLLRLVIGLKISNPLFNQWEAKPEAKPQSTFAHVIFPALWVR